MRVNDHDLMHRPRTETGQASEVSILAITPTLLMRQADERRQRPVAPEPDPLLEQVRDYEYRVGPYDVLSVIVWDHPELTIPAGEFRSAETVGHPVTAGGTMFYPHVGVVQVVGKTLSEVRQLLTERLSRVVERPQLDVKVAAFRSQRVHVTGEVTAPGAVPITDVPLRVLDAIALVRGPAPEADLGQVVLLREGRVHVLDLQTMDERGGTTVNWLLKDGDVLHVPNRNQNKVFVMGEVRRPSSRVMIKGRMTLAEAINDAEGFTPDTSNPSGVYVFRGDFAKPSIYKLDARSPDAMLLAAQFELQPRDVIYVSTTPLTQWNRVVQQLLPTVQSLWYGLGIPNQAIELQRLIAPTP